MQAPPLRVQQTDLTRRRILEAARAIFERRGYAGARIEDIAREAGVAVPTVYKTFANKRNLLASGLAMTMTGGEEERVERQAWFQEQLGASTAEEQLRLIARNARRINERAGRLLEVLRAAAQSDSEIEALWREVSHERMSRGQVSARRLAGKATLRMSRQDTARTLWTLTAPELYAMQTGAGLKPARYEQWLAELLIAALLQPESKQP
jgi:AcrR family transcriptional regulator